MVNNIKKEYVTINSIEQTEKSITINNNFTGIDIYRYSHVYLIHIDTYEEPVYRKNKSLEQINTFLFTTCIPPEIFVFNDDNKQYSKIHRDIQKSPYSYEKIIHQIMPMMMNTSDTIVYINKDQATQNLLGNPTPDQICTAMNNYVRQDPKYNKLSLQINNDSSQYTLYRYVQPTQTSRPIDDNRYYEDIDGIILPNI